MRIEPVPAPKVQHGVTIQAVYFKISFSTEKIGQVRHGIMHQRIVRLPGDVFMYDPEGIKRRVKGHVRRRVVCESRFKDFRGQLPRYPPAVCHEESFIDTVIREVSRRNTDLMLETVGQGPAIGASARVILWISDTIRAK